MPASSVVTRALCPAKYEADLQVIESSSISNEIRTAASAGDTVYDFAAPSLDIGAALAGEDLLINLKNLDSVDLTNEAWDQNAVRDFSIANKLYYGVSDISLGKNETTWIYFFNKNLIAEYQLENPYELVREGKWTFDKSIELMAAASHDTDGNGEPNEGDRFGTFRIYDAMRYAAFYEMSLEDKLAWTEKRIFDLERLRSFEFATATAKALWLDNLEYQINYFTRLLRQLEQSTIPEEF